MKNDRILCRSCSKIFYSTNIMHDEEADNYRELCPYCNSYYTENIESIIKQGLEFELHGGNWNGYNTYLNIKAIAKSQGLNITTDKIEGDKK